MALNTSDRLCLTPQFDNDNWNREIFIIIHVTKYTFYIATQIY